MFSNYIITPAKYNNIINIDGIDCGVFSYGDINVLNIFIFLIKPKIWA